MIETINNYLSIIKGSKFIDNFEESNYKISGEEYCTLFSIHNRKFDNEIIVDGYISTDIAEFSIKELTYMYNGYISSRNTIANLTKNNNHLDLETIIEDSTTLFDEEGEIVRTKKEKKEKNHKVFKIEELDLNKNLLSNIKIVQPRIKTK